MTPLPPGSTIGIIGGGQLGRMLALAAARLGYRTAVLDPDADGPAAQVTSARIVAPHDDPAGLECLADMADVVTYEFENVPVAAVERLSRHLPVHPRPLALEVAQDRLVEKRFLNDCGIATAAFRAVDDDASLADALDAFGGRGVLKTRTLGYDGKGQRVFREAGDVSGVHEQMGAVPLILESLVDFSCEISVIGARAADGSVACFDPALNVHREGILRSSTLPAGIGAATADAATLAARGLMEALDYVGVLGLEFFVLPDGSLLANEFAPRVHNSGHWTEAACLVSQFEQHIRAVAGLPLGDPARHADCVMENLIGDEVDQAITLAAEPRVMLNLYGKAEARPGRKMGHFTRLTGPKS